MPAVLKLKFLYYSESKKFLTQPDIVEFEGEKWHYDLILGCKSMKKLGVVLDFQAKTITIDEIILPMRNISSL